MESVWGGAGVIRVRKQRVENAGASEIPLDKQRGNGGAKAWIGERGFGDE